MLNNIFSLYSIIYIYNIYLFYLFILYFLKQNNNISNKYKNCIIIYFFFMFTGLPFLSLFFFKILLIQKLILFNNYILLLYTILINTYILYLYFNSIKFYIINTNNQKVLKNKYKQYNKHNYFTLFVINLIFNFIYMFINI